MTESQENILDLISGCRNVVWQLQNSLLQLSVEKKNRELADHTAGDLTRLARQLSKGGLDVLARTLEESAAGLAAGDLDEARITALYGVVEVLALTLQEGWAPLGKLLERLGPLEQRTEVREAPSTGGPAELDPDDLKLFSAEAREHLAAVEVALLDFERNGSPEIIAEVFRAVHSIKGGAQYVGLAATATLAHRMEALLDRLRKGERVVGAEAIAALLAAADGLSGLIAAAETGVDPAVDVEALVARVDAALPAPNAGLQATASSSESAPSVVAPVPVLATEPKAESAPEVGPDRHCDGTGIGPGSDGESDFELFAREYKTNASELHRHIASLDGLARQPEEARLLARALHSLKGIAGFIGAADMERLASALDLLLERVFRHRDEVPPDVKRVALRTEEALESLFEALESGRPPDLDVPALLGQLVALREREEKTMAWGHEPEPQVRTSTDEDPLGSRLAAVAAAAANRDGELLRQALDELASTAELQGLQDLSDAANAASLVAPGFVSAGADDLVERLRGLLPADDDLLAPPSPAERGVGAGERTEGAIMSKAQEERIVEDDFDLDLVRIFLDTTSERLSAISSMLARGASREAAELLGDMASAAAYMGYEPLSVLFASARVQLEKPLADLEAIAERLLDADRTIESLRLKLRSSAPAIVIRRGDAGDAGEPPRPEPAFREAALEHLEGLTSELLALEQGGGPDRREAFDRSLSGLRATATALGRNDVLGATDRVRIALEGAARPGTAPDREGVGELAAAVEALYSECGLVPPTPRIASASEPAATPAPLGRALGTDATVQAPADALLASGPSLAEAAPRPAISPSPDEGESARGLVEAQATVRVDTKKIDDLMNMVAELVVNRSSFLVLSSSVREVLVRLLDTGRIGQVEARDLRHVLDRYDEATTDLGRVSNQLQEGVMRIRMMPVRTLFARVPRLVRDLALREGKQVRVIFSGEETELDKTVIEQLSDPLVHLLRNAVSHGLEAPDERTMASKAPEGTLRVAARHQGNMVILDVEDDGRGIDLEAVRRVLVDRGLSSQPEAARLAPRDLMAALFLPGFSTAVSVSDVSGRGVGLDVVKRNIESLGGQIEVFTDAGLSTRFSIRIPLTMAIMQALLVRAGDEVYSIPVSAVIQTVKIAKGDLSTVEGQEVLTLRGRVVPLVRLSDVFDYRYHEETGQGRCTKTAESTLYAVVLQGEGREIAIAAESMIGSQDLVIKSLEDDLVDARGVAGAAILGDGTVTLILDVPEIQKMAVDRERYRSRRASESLRAFERLVRDRVPSETVTVH